MSHSLVESLLLKSMLDLVFLAFLLHHWISPLRRLATTSIARPMYAALSRTYHEMKHASDRFMPAESRKPVLFLCFVNMVQGRSCDRNTIHNAYYSAKGARCALRQGTRAWKAESPSLRSYTSYVSIGPSRPETKGCFRSEDWPTRLAWASTSGSFTRPR